MPGADSSCVTQRSYPRPLACPEPLVFKPEPQGSVWRGTPHGNTALAAGRSEAGKLCGGELVAEELMARIGGVFWGSDAGSPSKLG